MGSLQKSAAELRDIIAKALALDIELHRSSREQSDAQYHRPVGEVTEDEIDDYISSNPLLDTELARNLLDPGLLGFPMRFARIRSEDWEEVFESLVGWADNQTWLAADDLNVYFAGIVGLEEPFVRRKWEVGALQPPGWIAPPHSVLTRAMELIERGQLLSGLEWREFERLIGELLEREGWGVEVMRGSKDGGIDVVAVRHDALLGSIRSLWQAKKYGEDKKVRLSQARELSGVVERERATKGVIVTTGNFTSGALDWIRQDEFRLSGMDRVAIQEWVRRHMG